MPGSETTPAGDVHEAPERTPEELRDAVVTRRLVRVGIGAACFLLLWVPIVFLAFRG